MEKDTPATELKAVFRFYLHIINLNAPKELHWEDRKEIFDTVKLSFAPMIEILTVGELSRMIARMVYREVKQRGWRKKKVQTEKGYKSVWTKERSYKC